MKIKISEAERQVLDYLVSKREGFEPPSNLTVAGQKFSRLHAYSTDWSQGGPIIEREKIECLHDGGRWYVDAPHGWYEGPTLLIAAMRCYVASQLGDEVEVPEELSA